MLKVLNEAHVPGDVPVENFSNLTGQVGPVIQLVTALICTFFWSRLLPFP